MILYQLTRIIGYNGILIYLQNNPVVYVAFVLSAELFSWVHFRYMRFY